LLDTIDRHCRLRGYRRRSVSHRAVAAEPATRRPYRRHVVAAHAAADPGGRVGLLLFGGTLSVFLNVCDCARLLVALDDPHQRTRRPELVRPIAEVEKNPVLVGGRDRLGLELAGRDVVGLALVFGAPADRRVTARSDLLALSSAYDLFRLLSVAGPPRPLFPVAMKAGLAELIPDRVRVAGQVIAPALLSD